MSILKFLFVLLILIPIAILLFYFVDNLLNVAKQAKTNAIDFEAARAAKRKAGKKEKRAASKKSVRQPKEKKAKTARSKAEPKTRSGRLVTETTARPGSRQASKPAKKTKRKRTKTQARPVAEQRSAPPSYESTHDHSRSYIEEYNKRRAEIENNSRQAGRGNTAEKFDLLYGDGSTDKQPSSKQTATKKPTDKKPKSRKKK